MQHDKTVTATIRVLKLIYWVQLIKIISSARSIYRHLHDKRLNDWFETLLLYRIDAVPGNGLPAEKAAKEDNVLFSLPPIFSFEFSDCGRFLSVAPPNRANHKVVLLAAQSC